MPTPTEALDALQGTVWTCRNIRDAVNFHGTAKDALADNIEAVCADHERLTSENAKLRFLISEVVETQPVSDACRDDLRAALKT